MRFQNFLRRIVLPEHLSAYLFIALGLIGISHHEMWLDEMHHWQLGRDSATLSELFHNARYDVHPLLWDILLFVIARFTHDPVWMQILNLSFSCIAVILVLKYAPFSKIMKVLIIFGYFVFYEYTVISRNYALGMLLIIICCVLYPKRTNHYFLFAVLLGILANTHLFALLVSFAFFIALTVDYLLCQTLIGRQKLEAFSGLLLYAGFVSLAVIQIIPPSDSIAYTLLTGDVSGPRVNYALSILTQSFFPIPQLNTASWWNTNFLVSHTPASHHLIPILILVIPLLIFVKRLVAMIIFYFTAISTMLFIFFFWVGGVRYFGFVLISFMAALWIAEYYPSTPLIKLNKTFESISHILAMVFIYVVLIIQVAAGGIAWVLDFQTPFSQSRNTALYLVKHQLPGKPVAVSSCDVGVPVNGYLDQKVFNAQINKWGSFCEWHLLSKVSHDTIFDRVKQFSRTQNGDITMILNYLLFNATPPGENDLVYEDSLLRIHFLKEFSGSTVRSENYFIYRIYYGRKKSNNSQQ